MQQLEITPQSYQLEQTDYLLRVFHMLESPLAVIMGYAQLLEDPLLKKDPSFLEKCQQVVVKEARQMDQIIHIAALLARLEANHHQMEMVTIPLDALLNKVARNKDGKVKVGPPYDAPTIFGDPIWLKEALESIVDIASGDLSIPAQIEVKNASDQDLVCIQIRSKYSTLTKEEQSVLAGPIQGLKEKNLKKISGRSLGLILADQVIHRHQGRLEFDQLQGTEIMFNIFLPLVYQAKTQEGKL